MKYDLEKYHNKIARFDCVVMMASSLFSSAFFLFLGLFALHVNNGDNWLTQVSIVMSIIGMVGFVFCVATYGTRFWK